MCPIPILRDILLYRTKWGLVTVAATNVERFERCYRLPITCAVLASTFEVKCGMLWYLCCLKRERGSTAPAETVEK
jgi:hypothetical protein